MTRVTKTEAEIDKIVDDLVKDEKTANALKEKLHDSLEGEEAEYIRPVPDDDDADDMWDNMPV
ncbi:hypothetical protein [Celeribacter persicus]|jgi:hypothetical protein|uniref:Uncharacterized protein n=1 Tax=Celeribacter persicus TaxID=1651082 RepID=A0A2T5HBB9_9RHOB|nr:hypothetical protein [Celeribacter persicus]PTQ68874.1 hypothetical protein C8N42_11315 [Celeribacter persicus]